MNISWSLNLPPTPQPNPASDNPGGINGSMQHPLKSTQSLNIDWDKPKLLNGAKNQLLFCKNPEKPKTYCLRRTSDSLVVLHRPVEPARLLRTWRRRERAK